MQCNSPNIVMFLDNLEILLTIILKLFYQNSLGTKTFRMGYRMKLSRTDPSPQKSHFGVFTELKIFNSNSSCSKYWRCSWFRTSIKIRTVTIHRTRVVSLTVYRPLKKIDIYFFRKLVIRITVNL